MRKCSICKKKDEGVIKSGSFFQVPKDETIRSKWNEACGITFTGSAFVCQDHFLRTDYKQIGNKRFLMLNVVPFVHNLGEANVPQTEPTLKPSLIENKDDNECFINGMIYKCRTCFDPGLTIYRLNDKCSQSKTWIDFLKDTTQIQTNKDELLPKTVCCKCLEKIKAFYHFKLQIEIVNREYLNLLENSNKSNQEIVFLNKIDSSSDCLAESEIEIEEFLTEMKANAEAIAPGSLNTDNHVDLMIDSGYNVKNIHSKKLQEQKRSTKDNLNQNLNDNSNKEIFTETKANGKIIAPISLNTVKSKNSMLLEEHKRSLEENFNQNLNENLNNCRSLSSEEKGDDIVSLTSLKEKIGKIDDHFMCLVCKKTFSFRGCCRRHIQLKHSRRIKLPCGFCKIILSSRDNLYRHLKQKHPNEDLESNMKQIQRIFGERIYSEPISWRLIECKLCSKTFGRTKELREHLKKHCDINTLHKINSNDLIVKHLFPSINDIYIIKQIISKDISERNYFKYYTILNEFYYEMSISDTEPEDIENDEDTEHATKYECELCDKKFSFKYQVFLHLKEYHYRSKFPWTCDRCKLEFVSKQIYEHHIKTHCYNMNKFLSCTRCPGTFVWPQNMKNHDCALNIINSEDIDRKIVPKTTIAKPIILCILCNQSFKKLRHLHEHMPFHADGKSGIDFENSVYVNNLKESKKSIAPEKLQKKIQKAYRTSQISLFYQAIDTQGNELDISDSECCSEDTNSGDDIECEFVCDICNEIFKKRKDLLQHQEEYHKSDKLPYKCRECNQEYVNFHLLQQHFKKVCLNKHRRKARQCEYCKDRFIWRNSILIHKQIQHPKFIEPNDHMSSNSIAKSFTFITPNEFIHESSLLQYCLMCPKVFFTIEHLNYHLLRHIVDPTDINTIDSILHSTLWPNGEKKIVCKNCNQTFKTMSCLREHFSTKNLQNVCSDQHSIGNYSITNQKGFELHLELDSETEGEEDDVLENDETIYPYICYICNKSFKRKYLVMQHQRSKHCYELIELKCERCIFRTVSQKVLDYHKTTQCFNLEKEHKCEQCKFKFMWKENLCNHIKTYNSSDGVATKAEAVSIMNSNKSSPNNSKVNKKISGSNNNKNLEIAETTNNLSGTGASEIFVNSTLFGIHTGGNSENISIKCKKNKMKTQKLCPVCGAYLSGSSSLTIHMRKHTGEKPYKCNLCDMAYSRKSHLTAHQRIHTGERPYQCADCGKTFAKQQVFIRHRRIHTGERPYKCKFCEKTFYHNSNYQLHERRHTGEKPYICKVCNREFTCYNNLKSHRKNKGHN
ncbi:uncharacterized protein ACRADG_006483 isoform 2-T2 [Cochliomyia hominivorax]